LSTKVFWSFDNWQKDFLNFSCLIVWCSKIVNRRCLLLFPNHCCDKLFLLFPDKGYWLKQEPFYYFWQVYWNTTHLIRETRLTVFPTQIQILPNGEIENATNLLGEVDHLPNVKCHPYRCLYLPTHLPVDCTSDIKRSQHTIVRSFQMFLLLFNMHVTVIVSTVQSSLVYIPTLGRRLFGDISEVGYNWV